MAHPVGGESVRPRGRLTIYLGAVAGSGKTYAMLNEGRARRARGEDVVVAYVETHGRRRTADAIGSLEVIRRLEVNYHGADVPEMDLDAVVRRHPAVALVDELAHTNVPGLGNAKRWQDVEALRAAGIEVITTLNVQHVDSLKDVVEAVTGTAVRETVPDSVLDGADDVRFIDITPEALRKRMRHGNVYPPERATAALANFFREGNLAALRELGLRYVADRAGTALAELPGEDVLVAVSGDAGSAHLIRRGVRIARRYHGSCSVIHVRGDACDHDDEWRSTAETLGCAIAEVRGSKSRDVINAIIDAVVAGDVRHVVIGEDRGRRRLGRRNIVREVVSRARACDVHVIARQAKLPTRTEAADSTRGAAALYEESATARPSAAMAGSFRICLEYARGCGAGATVLAEAARRAGRGADVVIAAAPRGAVIPTGVDQVGRGADDRAGWRLDVDALLARNPEVACIGDLGAMTTDGRGAYVAVNVLRKAGMAVLASACVADLQSMERLAQYAHSSADHVSVPDAVLTEADEVELVDVSPADLQAWLRRGDIVPMAEVAPALQGMYRLEVLSILRETALRRVTELSDRRLVDYMDREAIRGSWEARARILLVVGDGADGEGLIHGTAALAERRGDLFTVLSVRSPDNDDDKKQRLGLYATLVHRLGGTFISAYDTDPVRAIVTYACGRRITEIVVSRTDMSLARTIPRLIDSLSDVDVHVVSPRGR